METRGGKYGRNLAVWLNYTIRKIEETNPTYRKRLLATIKDFSVEPRKKGTPINSGCINELDGIETIDPENPEESGKLIKEGIHLMYQKKTAERVLKTLLENLEG